MQEKKLKEAHKGHQSNELFTFRINSNTKIVETFHEDPRLTNTQNLQFIRLQGWFYGFCNLKMGIVR